MGANKGGNKLKEKEYANSAAGFLDLFYCHGISGCDGKIVECFEPPKKLRDELAFECLKCHRVFSIGIPRFKDSCSLISPRFYKLLHSKRAEFARRFSGGSNWAIGEDGVGYLYQI